MLPKIKSKSVLDNEATEVARKLREQSTQIQYSRQLITQLESQLSKHQGMKFSSIDSQKQELMRQVEELRKEKQMLLLMIGENSDPSYNYSSTKNEIRKLERQNKQTAARIRQKQKMLRTMKSSVTSLQREQQRASRRDQLARVQKSLESRALNYRSS